jgi:hypothetical protein
MASIQITLAKKGEEWPPSCRPHRERYRGERDEEGRDLGRVQPGVSGATRGGGNGAGRPRAPAQSCGGQFFCDTSPLPGRATLASFNTLDRKRHQSLKKTKNYCKQKTTCQ